MFNLSLARIMYGTKEDFHTSHSMLWSSLRTPAAGFSPASVGSENAASGRVSLSALLHKAWISVTNRK